MQERVQKFLSHSGVASRRQAEQMMLDGRVTVNGTVVRELGAKVDPAVDSVKVDGKRVHGETPAYVLLYKPKGTICTLDDPQGRPKVTDLVKGVRARLFPVGRLDFDTSGALLLTNDGELANLLAHPRHHVARTYVAKVKGVPSPDKLEKLRKGVYIEGGRTRPARARVLSVKEKNSLLLLELREGRNRQVKHMCQAIGHACLRLERVAFGFLDITEMKPGEWRHLLPREVEGLRDLALKSEPGDEAGRGPRRAKKRRGDEAAGAGAKADRRD